MVQPSYKHITIHSLNCIYVLGSDRLLMDAKSVILRLQLNTPPFVCDRYKLACDHLTNCWVFLGVTAQGKVQ